MTKMPRSYGKPKSLLGEKFESYVNSVAWETVESYLRDAVLGYTTSDVEIMIFDPHRKLTYNLLLDVRPKRDEDNAVIGIEVGMHLPWPTTWCPLIIALFSQLAEPEQQVSRYLKAPVNGSVGTEMEKNEEAMLAARKKLSAGTFGRMVGKSDGGPKSYQVAAEELFKGLAKGEKEYVEKDKLSYRLLDRYPFGPKKEIEKEQVMKGVEEFFSNDGTLNDVSGAVKRISRMSAETAARTGRPMLDMRSFAVMFASYFYSKSRCRLQVI